MSKKGKVENVVGLARARITEKELGWRHAVDFLNQWLVTRGRNDKQRNITTRNFLFASYRNQHLSEEEMQKREAGFKLAERLLAEARKELSRR